MADHNVKHLYWPENGSNLECKTEYATRDSAGNVIKDTYVKKGPLTIDYSQDNNYAITLHDTDTNNLAEIDFDSSGGSQEFTFPNKSGTLALTSDLSSYLPLSGGTMTGDIDFSSSSTWIKPYLLAFKNADTSSSPTYPYTGFYQWGNEWQVNARDASNTFVHNLLTINNSTKVATFAERPNVNGSNLALVSDIPAAVSASASTVSGATEAKSITIGSTSWNLPSGGGSGITEISTQYIRIWGLAAGVYKLTYAGTKYLYYYGSTGTNVHTVEGSSGSVILTISDYSTTYKHWWYINGSTGHASICHGWTSSSSGSVGTAKAINNLLTSAPAAGTKLYLHTISGFTNTATPSVTMTLYVINTMSSAYQSGFNFQFTNPFNSIIPSESFLSVKASFSNSTVTVIDGFVSSSNTTIKYIKQNSTTTIYADTYKYSNITDTVTAL